MAPPQHVPAATIVRVGPDSGREDRAPGRPPRVLILIKGLGLGGAERLVVDLVTRAGRHRFDYEVAYVLAAQDALAPALESSGVPVHALGATSTADIRWLVKLRRLLDGGAFDVLHSHLPFSAAMGRLVALSIPPRLRPVLVYTEHSLWDRAAIATRILNGATACLDDATIVVSAASRDALPSRLRDEAQVIIHGIDQEPCRELLACRERTRVSVREELGIAEGELLVLTVANLRKEKGYDVLIDAARGVVAEDSRVRFVSAGWGPLESELVAARDAAGLGDRLEFLGRRTDVMRLMAGSDVFVLASRQEGVPVSIMEAMSLGLPVVATSVGGVVELVTSEVNGLLVSPGRPDLLAQALSRLTKDAALRSHLAQGALHDSVRFDVSRISEQIESLYLRLLQERSR